MTLTVTSSLLEHINQQLIGTNIEVRDFDLIHKADDLMIRTKKNY